MACDSIDNSEDGQVEMSILFNDRQKRLIVNIPTNFQYYGSGTDASDIFSGKFNDNIYTFNAALNQEMLRSSNGDMDMIFDPPS